jgi:hypothetical protein
MARGDKKTSVASYLQKHPDAKNGDVAQACGCSVPMVSVVRRELGLTGSARKKGRTTKGKRAMTKRTRVIANAPSQELLEHLAAALKYVDSSDALLELLDHVEAAGGIESIRSALDFHDRLSQAMGL